MSRVKSLSLPTSNQEQISTTKVNIFGFTLLRNGVKYDYCFQESLKSLLGVTQSIYLALGKSEDETEALVKKLERIKIIPTIWDEAKREGGLILSEQTNIALEQLRAEQQDNDQAWGIYLQCDEVLHEEDYELIKQDIEIANRQGCDVVAFRYFHFWQSHHQIAINKKWYPNEIRAVKLKSQIESWGDAQSFRNYQRIYYSEARVFHYGHIRREDLYHLKKQDMLKLYHSDNKIQKYRKREKRFDDQTECIQYFGPQPSLMKDRMSELGESWTAPPALEVIIIDPRREVDNEFVKRINSLDVKIVKNSNKFRGIFRAKVINLNSYYGMTLESIVKPFPRKMRSKLAKKWSLETYLTLRLSQLNISVKNLSDR